MNRRRKLRLFPIAAECRVEEMESRVLLSGQGAPHWGIPIDEVRPPGENRFNRQNIIDGQSFNVRIVLLEGDQETIVHTQIDVFASFSANLDPGQYRLEEQNSDGSWATAACLRVAQAAAPRVNSPAPSSDFEGALPVSWEAIPDATSYELKLFAANSSQTLMTYSNLTGTSFTIPEDDLTAGFRYRIQLFGVFADGPTTGWPVDNLQNTAHGLRENLNVSVSTDNDQNVTVGWGRRYLTPEPSTTLHLYVNHVGDRPTAVYDTRTAVTDATTSYLIPHEFENGEYEVWARLFFGDGTYSRWGQPTSLVIDNSSIDTRPRILTPNYSHDITAQRWTITWTSSTLDESYDLWVAPRDDIANPTINERGITGTSYTTPFDLNPDTYTIQVRANLSTGSKSAWSLPVAKAVHPHGLDPIVITDGFGQTNDTTPYFQWEAVANVTDGYHIFISPASDPSNPIYERRGITDGNDATGLHLVDTPLPNNRAYYVWVRATYDSQTIGLRNSRWGSPTTLVIGNDTSGASLAQIPFTQGDIATTNLTPTLTWESRDNVDRYELWISFRGDRRVAAYHVRSLQEASHELESELIANYEYEAWVRAHYSDGTKTIWGAPFVFEIGDKNADPRTPMNFTAGLDDPTDATPELAWQARRFAHNYEIYINKVNDRANPVYHVTSPATADTSHIVTEPLEDNTEYEFWLREVHRYDDGRNSRWGATPQTFTTGTTIADFDQMVPQLHYEDGKLAWNAIAGATRYHLVIENIVETVDRGTLSNVVYDEFITGTSASLSLRRGDYVAVLQAENAEGHVSRQSAAFSFSIDFQSNQPSLKIDGNTASWNPVPTATSYRLWVNEYDSAGQLVQIRAILTTVTGTGFEMNLTAGIYRGWLQAMNGNNERSMWSEQVSFTIA